jgi:predicted nucleic acid-binding protein
MAAVLVDTNLLFYAHDPSDPAKQTRAIDILAHLHSTGIGRLSTQTLAEFFAAATRGKKPLLTARKAAQQVENLASSWIVLDVTSLIVIEAVRGVRIHKFAYWDSQIWATARLNQIPTVFTEDFNVGSTIEGVRFVNPLASDFQIVDWQ